LPAGNFDKFWLNYLIDQIDEYLPSNCACSLVFVSWKDLNRVEISIYCKNL
jgi:hypothetical protein